MASVIDRYRTLYKNVPSEVLVDRYYTLLEKINEAKGKKDFQSMLSYCEQSISLIEPLINECKREYGVFDIKSIPAIELGSMFFAIYSDNKSLLMMQEVVEYFPELAPWKETIEKAFYIDKLSSQICEYISSNVGCLQKDLKKVLSVDDGSLIAQILYYLGLTGKVRREKQGNTYLLYHTK